MDMKCVGVDLLSQNEELVEFGPPLNKIANDLHFIAKKMGSVCPPSLFNKAGVWHDKIILPLQSTAQPI